MCWLVLKPWLNVEEAMLHSTKASLVAAVNDRHLSFAAACWYSNWRESGQHMLCMGRCCTMSRRGSCGPMTSAARETTLSSPCGAIQQQVSQVVSQRSWMVVGWSHLCTDDYCTNYQVLLQIPTLLSVTVIGSDSNMPGTVFSP